MSRRKNRHERRNAKRKKKKEYLKQYDNYKNVVGFKPLYKSAINASHGVSWKASVQRFLLGILFKVARKKRELHIFKNVVQGFIEFFLNERGKIRHIKSVHFDQRVTEKSICSNAMTPVLTHGLIHDNSASQKGKGTHFAIERLTNFLHKYYRKYGCEGYVLMVDFKSYFESIPHESIKALFRKNFTDENIIKLADMLIDAFGDVGLGLGSETSQINAIIHIDKIDHYIKEIERIKGYGRYMDDSWFIHTDKEVLKDLLRRIEIKYQQAGITLNKKKTCIRKLKSGFTFLKTKFYLTETGKVVRKPCRKRITSERRKLKKQAKLYQQGLVEIDDITQSYNSWRGSMQYRTARKTVYNMDKLFKALFNKEWKNDKCNNRNKAV